MKTLLIMHHGLSQRSHGVLDYATWTLSEQGRSDVARMGANLRQKGLLPDHMECSTARPAEQSAVAVAKACGYAGDIIYRQVLYEGGLTEYLALLYALPDGADCALIVGHNPAIEELVIALSGMDRTLPPGALAQLRLAVDTWAAVSREHCGGLANVWRPMTWRKPRRNLTPACPSPDSPAPAVNLPPRRVVVLGSEGFRPHAIDPAADRVAQCRSPNINRSMP